MLWKIEIHLTGKDKCFIQIIPSSPTKSISNIIPNATKKETKCEEDYQWDTTCLLSRENITN